MNKTLGALFLVTLAAGLLFACKHKPSGDGDGDQQCLKQLNKGYGDKPPAGMLSVENAKLIADRYDADMEKAYISMDGRLTPVVDAHAVWMSLADIQAYLLKVQDTLCKQGCDLSAMNLGVHFYLGKYPGADTLKSWGVDPLYANHQTIFMTATYREKGVNIDFDPYWLGPDKCHPTPLSEWLQHPPGHHGNGGIDEPGVLNHGTLSPPPDGSGDFPSGGDGYSHHPH